MNTPVKNNQPAVLIVELIKPHRKAVNTREVTSLCESNTAGCSTFDCHGWTSTDVEQDILF
jgi:hypothetical protein